MHKRTLVLVTSLIFFTGTSYAEEMSLQEQVEEVQSKLSQLQEANDDLKKRLASYENEIAGWREALENIEGEIAALQTEGE